MVGVVAGAHSATVTWQSPLAAPFPIVAYVVTPWIGQTEQTPIRFDSTATSQTVTGLSGGTSYTFTVKAINTQGNDSASSDESDPVAPTGLNAIAVAAGGDHSCALLENGTINCWGLNVAGELGNGTTTDSTTPGRGHRHHQRDRYHGRR